MRLVLVIEDDERVRQGIVDILSDDYSILEAPNGKRGVELALQHIPECIVSDIMMPELDGFGVLEELQKHPTTVNIPFIFLSARADREDISDGMKVGADDYLTKPFDPMELLERIESRISKRDAIIHQAHKQLEQLRGNISASLPHEFQTPLNSILGFSELLSISAGEMQLDQIVQMSRSIFDAGQRLHGLIQNFLLYSHLESITSSISTMRDIRSKSMADSIVVTEEVKKCASKVSRLDDIHTDIQMCRLAISGQHLGKLTNELVSNACKFSLSGTPVTITGKPEGEMFILSISDKGRGIDQSKIEQIDAFIQFDRGRYEQQGAGLGLTIAKKILEVYGGSWDIQSTLGEGTSITISLPQRSEDYL
jgi:signal transduction histidine kinase